MANQRSGSLSAVDAERARVVSEGDVGRGLADVAVLPDGCHLLAVDRAADRLLLLEWREESARVVDRLAMPNDPVRLRVWGDGSRYAVTSLGARRLTIVDLVPGVVDEGPAMKASLTLDLPFAPREMAPVNGGSGLVVADGFGGKLAVIDPARGSIDSVRTLPAHNIRGLATTPDGRSLVVPHQTLHRLARSSFEDVHWGSLIGNHLRIIRDDAVMTPGTDADLLRGSTLRDLGGAGNAAGDPSALPFGRSGDLMVALGGVDEAVLGRDPASPLRRTVVGGGPTAVGFDFPTNKRDHMTWDEIARVDRDGFEIGNHTRDHKAPSAKDAKGPAAQLEAIDARCFAHGISRPVSFAYPGNSLDKDVLPLLHGLGIKFVRRGGAPE